MKKKFVQATLEYADLGKEVPSPYLRRSFNLECKPEGATLKVCGLGFYRLFLNGKDITKGHLAPYISNPDHVCYYDEYDVGDMLIAGENVLGFR